MHLLSFFSSIPTHYDERKATAAAGYLLHVGGGRMPYLRLIKLLYIADREAWRRHGRPITGDDYVAMKHGPVLSHTYDLIKTEGEEPVQAGPWLSTIERVSSYDVRLRGADEPDLGSLSNAELEILQGVHNEFRNMGTWDIVAYLHETVREWKDPKSGSVPIHPEEILKALGLGDRIKAVKADMEELEEFRRLLRTP